MLVVLYFFTQNIGKYNFFIYLDSSIDIKNYKAVGYCDKLLADIIKSFLPGHSGRLYFPDSFAVRCGRVSEL